MHKKSTLIRRIACFHVLTKQILPQRDTQSFMSMQEIDEEKYQKSVKRKI